jgi:hypothetical protein
VNEGMNESVNEKIGELKKKNKRNMDECIKE